eukprot:GEMP01005444.1.p1 GENE.GEMP01005444.1~~GEMP01005444.1.p1  ORF type:complete len:889 (-),score=135.84 GEMP01005444.1:1225-3891(-)
MGSLMSQRAEESSNHVVKATKNAADATDNWRKASENAPAISRNLLLVSYGAAVMVGVSLGCATWSSLWSCARSRQHLSGSQLFSYFRSTMETWWPSNNSGSASSRRYVELYVNKIGLTEERGRRWLRLITADEPAVVDFTKKPPIMTDELKHKFIQWYIAGKPCGNFLRQVGKEISWIPLPTETDLVGFIGSGMQTDTRRKLMSYVAICRPVPFICFDHRQKKLRIRWDDWVHLNYKVPFLLSIGSYHTAGKSSLLNDLFGTTFEVGEDDQRHQNSGVDLAVDPGDRGFHILDARTDAAPSDHDATLEVLHPLVDALILHETYANYSDGNVDPLLRDLRFFFPVKRSRRGRVLILIRDAPKDYVGQDALNDIMMQHNFEVPRDVSQSVRVLFLPSLENLSPEERKSHLRRVCEFMPFLLDVEPSKCFSNVCDIIQKSDDCFQSLSPELRDDIQTIRELLSKWDAVVHSTEPRQHDDPHELRLCLEELLGFVAEKPERLDLLQKELSEASNKSLEKLREKKQQLYSALQNNQLSAGEKKEHRAELADARRQISHKTLSLDKILAVYNMLPYEADEQGTEASDRKAMRDTFASILNYGVVQLIDGDHRVLHERLWTDVLKENKDLGGKSTCVISIIGPQSTGKSTLLNRMFPSRFPTSAAGCTMGINATLCEHNNASNLLVLDTEGLCCTEQDHAFDGNIRPLVMATSDIVIINIDGQGGRDMHELLQLIEWSVLEMKIHKLGKLPKLVFVLQNCNTDDTDQKEIVIEHLTKDVKRVCDSLQEIHGSASLSEICFASPSAVEEKLVRLPPLVVQQKTLNEQLKPVLVSNRDAADSILDLKKRLLGELDGKPLVAQNLQEWFVRFTSTRKIIVDRGQSHVDTQKQKNSNFP